MLAIGVMASGLMAPGGAAAQAPAAAAPAGPVLLVLGDSLSAEYGLAKDAGWVHGIALKLQAAYPGWQVVNASISGDTSDGGRNRLPPLLARHHPRVVIIALGGNDGLRGLPVAATRANFEAMGQAVTASGARLMLAGIQVPPNYGRRYNEDLAAVYRDVAAQQHAALLPFLLAGVADRPDADDWFQADRIHPLAKGHPIIVEHVWPVLQPLLQGAAKPGTKGGAQR